MSETYEIHGDARFALRSDTLKNWREKNPILLSGEPSVVTGLEKVGDGLCSESERVKFGDGVTPWNDLPWWKGPKGNDGVGVGEFTEQGGEIFNDYENNQALHKHTSVHGEKCTAGTKAFQISHIDFENNSTFNLINRDKGTTYYIGTVTSEAPDGTEANPYATVIDAIIAANTAGVLTQGDTLNIAALSDVSWGEGITPEHVYDIVVKSKDTANPVTVNMDNKSHLGGTTTFAHINATTGTSSGTRFYLDGKNFTLAEGASLRTYALYCGSNSVLNVLGQTVIINGSLYCTKRFVVSSEGSGNTLTYSDYLDIVINDPHNNYTIGLARNNTKHANTRINIKTVKGLMFEECQGDFTDGSIQIINSTGFDIAPDTPAIAHIEKKWILYNSVPYFKDVIEFTDVAGVYTIGLEHAATAISVDNVYENVGSTEDGILNLSIQTGIYDLEIIETVKQVGIIALDTVVGLEENDVISIKEDVTQTFEANVGTITVVDSENNILFVEGYPSKINKFLLKNDTYLFVLQKPTVGSVLLGEYSNANGLKTKAIGKCAHTEGEGTIAIGDHQFVCGKYNANKSNTVFELGCGTSDNNRANALEVYKDGNIVVGGIKITAEKLSKLSALLK